MKTDECTEFKFLHYGKRKSGGLDKYYLWNIASGLFCEV